ncbi:MAG: helix-turn-helix transcriptional regulator [Oscillospiraceae bacterium]|nr:helix-turn-helix transcriptional regulator [Oscillospiraceae bacterium]
MVIYMLGWHWRHPSDLAIERPNGHFGMQILLVQSKARIRMGEQEYRVEPNTVFLIKSCMPHCIYADGEEYCDDWVRFSVEQEDHALIDSLGEVWNVPIRLQDNSVSDLIRASEAIFRTDALNKQEALHHVMKAILLHIRSQFAPQPNVPHTHYDNDLERLRRDIFSNPARDWSIPEIAESLGLSESHFRRLYKNRYGISCTKDVWTSRMEYAKQLLLTTELSANEIADKCGYQSYEHFSRSFVKYACVSPIRYRTEHKQ